MMRFTIAFVFLALCFTGCSHKNDEVISDKEMEAAKVDLSKLEIETPQITEIDSSGILMMPLTIGSTTDDSDFGGSFDAGKRSFFWNIIFYNTTTSEKHLLSNDKILISNYDTDYGSSSSSSDGYQNNIDTNSSQNLLFYSIRSFDGNKNGKIDLEDPEYLFMSNRNGKNLKQVSPPNTHLTDWHYIKRSNKIILSVRDDRNGNKIWNDKDGLVTYEYDLNSDMPAKLIFDKAYKTTLKENFKKQWLQ